MKGNHRDISFLVDARISELVIDHTRMMQNLSLEVLETNSWIDPSTINPLAPIDLGPLDDNLFAEEEEEKNENENEVIPPSTLKTVTKNNVSSWNHHSLSSSTKDHHPTFIMNGDEIFYDESQISQEEKPQSVNILSNSNQDALLSLHSSPSCSSALIDQTIRQLLYQPSSPQDQTAVDIPYISTPNLSESKRLVEETSSPLIKISRRRSYSQRTSCSSSIYHHNISESSKLYHDTTGTRIAEDQRHHSTKTSKMKDSRISSYGAHTSKFLDKANFLLHHHHGSYRQRSLSTDSYAVSSSALHCKNNMDDESSLALPKADVLTYMMRYAISSELHALY
jgi:hypothetical protein